MSDIVDLGKTEVAVAWDETGIMITANTDNGHGMRLRLDDNEARLVGEALLKAVRMRVFGRNT